MILVVCVEMVTLKIPVIENMSNVYEIASHVLCGFCVLSTVTIACDKFEDLKDKQLFNWKYRVLFEVKNDSEHNLRPADHRAF